MKNTGGLHVNFMSCSIACLLPGSEDYPPFRGAWIVYQFTLFPKYRDPWEGNTKPVDVVHLVLCLEYY